MLRFNSSQPGLRNTQGSRPVLAGHIDNVLVTPSFHRTAGFPEERDFLGSYKPQQTKEELGSRGVTGGPTGEPLADIKAIPNAHLAKQHTFPNPAPPPLPVQKCQPAALPSLTSGKNRDPHL